MKRRYSCTTDTQKLSFKLYSRAWGSGDARERDACERIAGGLSWLFLGSHIDRQRSKKPPNSEVSDCF